jgi:hypothetical protein
MAGCRGDLIRRVAKLKAQYPKLAVCAPFQALYIEPDRENAPMILFHEPGCSTAMNRESVDWQLVKRRVSLNTPP